jgi:hypothetical protein
VTKAARRLTSLRRFQLSNAVHPNPGAALYPNPAAALQPKPGCCLHTTPGAIVAALPRNVLRRSHAGRRESTEHCATAGPNDRDAVPAAPCCDGPERRRGAHGCRARHDRDRGHDRSRAPGAQLDIGRSNRHIHSRTARSNPRRIRPRRHRRSSLPRHTLHRQRRRSKPPLPKSPSSQPSNCVPPRAHRLRYSFGHRLAVRHRLGVV